jgi:Ca-activated chloride channel homolog
MHFVFANPWLFLLVAALPLIWWYKRLRRPHGKQVINLATADQLPVAATWKKRILNLLPWCKYLALALLIAALARPQMVEVFKNIEGQGIDIVLSMDISPSMLAKDFRPDRLAVAKRVAMDFVAGRPVDRIGLVSFAGEAIIEYPLTTDHALIQSRINAMVVGELTDGTAIGMGLGTALTRLRDSTVRSRIVILMTDGENNAGYYSPQQAVDIAKELNVKVYTIGIGTDELAEAPIARNPNGTYEFAPRRLVIDEELMLTIAEQTGGKYFYARSEDTLREVYKAIDQLERSNYIVKEVVSRQELFHWLVLLAFFVLLFEAVVRWWWLKSIQD